MRNFLVILFVLSAAAIGWFVGAKFGFGRPSVSPTVALQNGPSLPVAPIVRGQGKLQPASGTIKIVAAPGERVAALTEKQIGETVELDEVLVTLHSRVLREKDLELAKARRADSEKNIGFEKELASFKLKSAQLALEEANAGEQKVAEKAKSIELLKNQQEVAQKMLDRLQNLKSNPATQSLVNQTDVEKQTLQVEQLRLQIEQAMLDVEIAKESARRAKEAAQNNLDTINYSTTHANDASPANTLDAAVNLAQLAYDSTQIRSPIENATILDIIVRAGDSVTNQPIMVLGDVSEMVCEVEVVDSFLELIDLEQHNNLRARISGTALKKPLMGTVIAKGVMIGPISLKTPDPFAKVDSRTGTVTIKLDSPAEAAKFVNMQVDVEIEVAPGTLSDSAATGSKQ